MSYIRLPPFHDPQPLDAQFKTVQSWRYHVDIRAEWWPDALDKARVLIPEFAKAEKDVERLKKQNKRLRAEVKRLKEDAVRKKTQKPTKLAQNG